MRPIRPLFDPSELRRRGGIWRRRLKAAALVTEVALRHPRHATRFASEAMRMRRAHAGDGLLAELRYRLGPHFAYPEWVRRFGTLTAFDRERIENRIAARDDWSLISVLMPVRGTDLGFLDAAIRSVRAQLYPRWELRIAVDAPGDPKAWEIIERHAADEARLEVVTADEESAGAENAGLGAAGGEFVAFIEADAMLAEHALYWMAEEIAAHPDAELLYSDSDSIDAEGARSAPLFKTGLDPEFLLGTDMVGHLALYRRSTVEARGGLRPGLGPDTLYDLALRIASTSGAGKVRHVPAVLYHARKSQGAVDGDPRRVRGATTAVSSRLAAEGIAAKVLPAHNLPGGRRIRYPLPEPAPHVSVIIPTRNQASLLRQALIGVLGETRYPALDVIVADNGSDEPDTLALFEELRDDGRVRVVPLPGPFNFSRINNEAVKASRGDVLAFLNNDVSIVDPGWLNEMVSRAMQPGVGAVGAKLYYPNGRIQHAGVVFASRGVARHCFAHAPRDLPGPMGELLLAREVSAVTAACMVMRRSAFEEVGGFDAEHLAVDFNDVDFCLRLRERGYRIIWTPFAELVHHESASRRADAEASHRGSRKVEAKYMRRRWSEALADDPFFSPNLSPDGMLAMPPRVKRPWD